MKYLPHYILLLFISGCDCNEPEFLIPEAPPPFQVEIFTDGDIVLTFNRRFDIETIIPGETLLINGEDIQYNGIFEWSENSIFISICDLNCVALQCEAQLTLLSNPRENTGVRSVDGAFLDGDKDGAEGGNFVYRFAAPTCDSGPQVTSPGLRATISDGNILNNNSQLTFRVEFNRPIERTTVEQGVSFLVQIPRQNITHLPGSISWDNDRQGLRFTTENSITAYCDFNPDCFLRVRLVLLGTNTDGVVITDENGLPLDGDLNFQPGGVFEAFFEITIIG